MKNHKGEIGTIVMMAVLVLVSVFSFASSSFVNKNKIASNPRARMPCEINQSHCVQECGSTSSCSNNCAKQNNVPDEGIADRICTSASSPTPKPPTNTPKPAATNTPVPTLKPATPTPGKRNGLNNCTPEQICGGYDNYVPGSQYSEGSIRVVTCKNLNIPASPASCNAGSNIPTSIPPDPDSPKCTSGSYTQLVGCEDICGIANCQSCKLGSTIKYECKGAQSLKACVKPRTYASFTSCEMENCSKCTQCKFGPDDDVRYECDGNGPTMAPIATPTSPPVPIKTNTPIPAPSTIPETECQFKGPNCNNGYFCISPKVCKSQVQGEVAQWCCPASVNPPTLTSTPVVSSAPNPTGTTPSPQKIKCTTGTCIYDQGFFYQRCPTGQKQIQGLTCFDNFGDDGWQTGNCCDTVPTIGVPAEPGICTKYTCIEACNKKGYFYSTDPNKSISYTLNNDQWYETCKAGILPVLTVKSFCGCTNILQNNITSSTTTSTAVAATTDNGESGSVVIVDSQQVFLPGI